MKRKFYLRAGAIFADLSSIQLIDYDYETKYFWVITRQGKRSIRIGKDEPRLAYFDSWEDAWEALRRRAQAAIVARQEAVTSAQRTADEIDKMTKPNYRPVGER